jgi:hypothetical protein
MLIVVAVPLAPWHTSQRRFVLSAYVDPRRYGSVDNDCGECCTFVSWQL